MEKKNKFKLIIIGIILLTLLFYGYNRYFFSFDNLEKGEHYQGPVVSPTGNYIANSFFKDYGGATGGANVWVEITDKNSDNKKIIYYSDGKSKFGMEWIDDKTISIRNDDGDEYPDSDRSIELNVETDIYDERGLACVSVVMKNEYKNCFHY